MILPTVATLTSNGRDSVLGFDLTCSETLTLIRLIRELQ
jgi:hypothetical protein